MIQNHNSPGQELISGMVLELTGSYVSPGKIYWDTTFERGTGPDAVSEKLWGQGLTIIQMDQTRMRLLGKLIAHARVRVCLVGGM